MNIVESILVNNPCYKQGRKITVKGLMLHSIGCPQPRATVFVKKWNKSTYNSACVHAFIDANDGTIYQTLPWNHRGWHGGGSSNNTHIGVEMCEPNTIKYTGGSRWTEKSDGTNTKACVMRTYNSAVELFAFLCKEFNLNPLKDGVIVSHSEGCRRGIASNHGDVEHIWKHFGLTMDQFRKDVAAKMTSTGSNVVKKDNDEEKDDVLYRVQIGAYSKRANGELMLAKVKKAGFTAILTNVNGLYKVQTGAFSKKSNAEAMLKKIEDAGFDGFITTTGGKIATNTVETTAKNSIQEGSKVKVKKGAKTYSGSNLASFVYDRVHIAESISNNRVVITYKGAVVAAVKLEDLVLA